MSELEKIPCVEDEPDIQLIIKTVLEKEGFELVLCDSGREALQKIPSFRPDLILLDVMMPEMDGPATFRAFRRIPETATTPVIFLTSKVQANEIAAYRALGAIDVLCKPFDPVTLAAVIRRIWEAAGKRR